MRYMMIVSGPEDLSKSGPPPQELIDEIGRQMEETTRQGKMVSFGGLKPTASGARLRVKNGKISTTDGPFAEAKEVIGGFSIFQFATREEALAEVHRFMELHQRYWPGWEGMVEMREMYEEQDDVRAEQMEGSRALQR